jgi:hypothetical protein
METGSGAQSRHVRADRQQTQQKAEIRHQTDDSRQQTKTVQKLRQVGWGKEEQLILLIETGS